MSLESDMVAAALANANTSSLISTRFFATNAPAVTRPLVVYQQIAAQGERTLGGAFVERRAQYQWRLVCDTYAQIIQLKSALKELAGTSYGTITRMDVEDGPDGYDFETERYTKILSVYLTK